ncbi:MAG: ribosomal-protein-alanine N-acetyltransferase [Saprospiraceae bacterium]|jgi:ribosomal-protein-alanine N-acetyltransferase
MKEVTLRAFTKSDIPRIATLANDTRISNNLRDYFPSPYKISDAKVFMDKIEKQNPKENHAIYWGEELVGNIGIHPFTDLYRFSGEIGYWLGVDYWGNGIMTKTVPQIIKYGFEVMNLRRIQAGVIRYNQASARVLEKCGLIFEAELKDKAYKLGSFHDELIYAIISNIDPER